MNKNHIHKRLTTDQVKEILRRYDAKEIDQEAAQAQLGVKRRRFFELLKQYRNDPDDFSIEYERESPKRIDIKTEKAIKKELLKEKKIVEDKNLPVKYYNYSTVQDILKNEHHATVSLPTIIARAKDLDCYTQRKKRKKIHDREVLTNYVGELVQHDSSHHQWSPYTDEKWYLITSIDDYSRYLLYADLVAVETAWKHISALESVCLTHGFPKSYYSDQHSIFRFVGGRDHYPHLHRPATDSVDTQWKKVIKDCGIEPIYALSPQAKGKVERPYRWMQDHIVRCCAKEQISKLIDVQEVLKHEVDRYNNRQVHSTTKEIPRMRFERAIEEGRTMFRPFQLPPPYESTKDIFALRATRQVDSYRKVSLYGVTLTVPKVLPRNQVDIRLYPNTEKQTVEVRFRFNEHFIGAQTVKMTDLKKVHF